MAELSYEINKEIALIINRRGQIINVTVGDADTVELPSFKNIREGEARLCGLRCIHTHPNGNADLSKTDLAALLNNRFDVIAAISVDPDKTFSRKKGENPNFADSIQVAYLLPDKSEQGDIWKILPTTTVREANNQDFEEFIAEIERNFAKHYKDKLQIETELAILVSLQTDDISDFLLKDSLNELEQLAFTAGAKVLSKIVQKKSRPAPATYIGSGKVKDIALLVQEKNANLVIFDAELSPNQQKKLEATIGVKTIDRTELILDIFAQRARTKEGKLQVELAQLKYLFPRLIGEGLSLSRQGGGGIGGGIATRGPGETKLEIDRRRIRTRIRFLKNEVDKIKSQRDYQRRQRQKNNLPVVSIVGYTNVGKSTLLTALSNSEIFVEDKLFATLDPTTRKIRLPQGDFALFSDTVGFIQRLPTSLIAAFRATLEEVAESDIILHVMDPMHPAWSEHVDTVYDILLELNSSKKPIITVINKADLIKDRDQIEEIKEKLPNPIEISALKRKGLHDLLLKLESILVLN